MTSLEILKGIRKTKASKPELVIKHGAPLLSSLGGSELYAVHEQVLIASLELGLSNISGHSLQVLRKKFPNSSRVLALVGMEYESKGNYDQALELYKSLLTEYPLTAQIMKRIVCIYKATGDYKNAIDEIHKILKYYPNDASTWQELSDIHLLLSDYTAAAFCH
jgi:tetratricopeptide (TPR) repeat protein